MTVSFHALWMLCSVCAVVFAASTRRTLTVGLFAGGYTAAVLLTGADRLPDPVTAGLLAIAAAALALAAPDVDRAANLFRSARARLARLAPHVIGGAVAGMWPALLEAQGLPQPAAVAVTAGLAGATAWLAYRRPRFAPDHLRDEALLVAGLLGAVVATMPGVLDGWQAARNLNVVAETTAVAVPSWTLAVVGAAVATGAAYSVWSRR